MQEDAADYANWSHASLVERVMELERELRARMGVGDQRSPTPVARPSKKTPRRPFNPAKYSTRFIALKFAYLGQNYNGFEYHANNPTRLPTVEETLWRALRKARLIFPEGVGAQPTADEEVTWDGCEYAKCGRTDRGVSAFGQVISLRVRSNRPVARKKTVEIPPRSDMLKDDDERDDDDDDDDDDVVDEESSSFDPIRDEISYPHTLNRILPEDIRILAWCPSPPSDFSARFSCKERQYRYFFTQPAFTPPVWGGGGGSPPLEPWDGGRLDLDAMREAARAFIGVHDFRNFCKVDASKQITNFERRVYHADIIEVDSGRKGRDYDDDDQLPIRCISNPPRICAFVVHGSAFLWHQVRQMVAVLFLIGQGLEPPSLVAELLHTTKHPRRPMYDMASDAPLVLWDCIFPHPDDPERRDALDWVPVGESPPREHGRSPSGQDKHGGMGALMEELWSVWRRRKMDEILAGSLFDAVADRGRKAREDGTRASNVSTVKKNPRIFDGSHAPKSPGVYVPLLDRRRMETVEEINQRYLHGKGQRVEASDS